MREENEVEGKRKGRWRRKGEEEEEEKVEWKDETKRKG
jgi:hypothetical protein